MNNNPNIFMYGESDGDKKGIKIIGNGQSLYNDSFNVELHGIEVSNTGIKNEGESVVNMTDIKTDSMIVNTGKSLVNMRGIVQKKKSSNVRSWFEKWWGQMIIAILTPVIIYYLGFS